MIPVTQSKDCITCGKPLRGRADKKFCNDNCRNNFNNQLKAGNNNYIRNINNALRKNRRILEEALTKKDGKSKTKKEKLLQKGFYLKYCTHTYTNNRGNTYFFCYEYGYLPMDNDYV